MSLRAWSLLQLSIAFAATIVTASAQTTYLNDNFSSATATTGSATVPAGVLSTTQWYESAANLSVNNSALQFTSGNAAYYTFFTQLGTTADIAGTTTGNYIDLSFDLTTSGTVASSGFKIGLFNSQANLTGSGFARPVLSTSGNGLITAGSSTQTTATAGNPYLNWSGYYVNFNPATTSSASTLQFFQRASSTTNSSLLTNGGSQVTLQGSSVAGTALSSGNTYHFDFTISTISATSLSLTATVSQGATVLNTDTLTLTSIAALGGTSFDTIGLNPNVSSGTPGWTMDNFSVVSVPEPTTYAMGAGMAALAAVFAWRMRRRAIA